MISLIAAVAQNRALGKDGQLLWHLPEDMRYFRETTRGKPVIMGRKTWESLPDVFRPLPGRRNIVISRNPAYDAPGATLAGSLEEAVRLAQDDAEVFVIGGAEIYRQALPLAQRLYLTEVARDFDADAFFPEFSASDWTEISRSAAKNCADLDFTFAVYQRI
jgi:dihydrofolate reductase